MSGTVSLQPVDSIAGAAAGPAPGVAPASYVNSFRVAAVMERMAAHTRGHLSDSRDFFNLCISLARGIDYAVANNEIPAKVHEMPALLKQAYHRYCNNESYLQPAIMVLMISVKNACRNRWFLAKDTDELLSLANEIGRGFSSPGDIYIEPTNPPHIISKVMSRFFPRIYLGRILALLEVKPGFGTFAVDFQILKNAVCAAQERIRLFVVQIDNISTSSCLISPPLVNFLLNGRAVDRRNNVAMDTGPQMPTNVTPMLKFGINLLQAVGQFNGDYIIAIAFMTMIPSPDVPVLQDYVKPVASILESDSEVIEGASRISLNCPISFKRIKTPVKGHLCKHHQCFDFENFIEMNSRRPSWRCPHCNQSVCYTDLRVDQNMAKVLEEVGENVVDVIISADGSWKPVIETDDHSGQQSDSALLYDEQDGTEQCASMTFSIAQADVVDLTVAGTDESHVMDTHETEDSKPFKDAVHGNSVTGTRSESVEVCNNSEVLQSAAAAAAAPPTENFWLGVLYASALNGTAATSFSEPPPTNLMLNPVLTDAVSPALNQQPMDVHVATQPITPIQQGQNLTPNSLQLQPLQVENSIITSEIGRPPIPRQVSRNPIAVQALPAQNHVHSAHQQRRTGMNPVIPNGASLSSAMPNGAPPIRPQTSLSVGATSDGVNVINGEKEMQQPLSSSSMQHHPSTQGWDHQDRPYIPSQSILQFNNALPVTTQVPSTYGASPGLPAFQNSNHQIPTNTGRHHIMSHSSTFPPRLAQPGVGQGIASQVHGSSTSSSWIRPMAAGQRVRSPPSVPVQLPAFDNYRTSIGEQRVGSLGGILSPSPRADDHPVQLPSEQNWRPTKRMRGSLSGQAYSAALSQFMIRPTLPEEASIPPPDLTLPTSLTTVTPHLQALLANNMNSHGPFPQHSYAMPD